jgi:hypothetical protein
VSDPSLLSFFKKADLVSDCLAQFMLKNFYREGFVLRMNHKESLKHIQQSNHHRQQRKSEYQTIRLFGVLGLLTVLLVLIFRLAQNGPHLLPQRNPASAIDTEGKK